MLILTSCNRILLATQVWFHKRCIEVLCLENGVGTTLWVEPAREEMPHEVICDATGRALTIIHCVSEQSAAGV